MAQHVNEGLTTCSRQTIVDNVPERPSALAAIGQAQALARSAEEELAMSVARARESGHTWAEIGQVLGTSRQAAFQRFGRPADPRTGQPMAPVVPGARELAGQLFGDLAAGRWAAVCAQFGPAVAARLDPSGLAAAWAQVIGMAGEFERRGEPSAYRAGDYTVVDVPLFFEAGERTGRVSYDQDARVAGLFFLPTERKRYEMPDRTPRTRCRPSRGGWPGCPTISGRRLPSGSRPGCGTRRIGGCSRRRPSAGDMTSTSTGWPTRSGTSPAGPEDQGRTAPIGTPGW